MSRRRQIFLDPLLDSKRLVWPVRLLDLMKEFETMGAEPFGLARGILKWRELGRIAIYEKSGKGETQYYIPITSSMDYLESEILGEMLRSKRIDPEVMCIYLPYFVDMEEINALAGDGPILVEVAQKAAAQLQARNENSPVPQVEPRDALEQVSDLPHSGDLDAQERKGERIQELAELELAKMVASGRGSKTRIRVPKSLFAGKSGPAARDALRKANFNDYVVAYVMSQVKMYPKTNIGKWLLNDAEGNKHASTYRRHVDRLLQEAAGLEIVLE